MEVTVDFGRSRTGMFFVRRWYRALYVVTPVAYVRIGLEEKTTTHPRTVLEEALRDAEWAIAHLHATYVVARDNPTRRTLTRIRALLNGEGL